MKKYMMLDAQNNLNATQKVERCCYVTRRKTARYQIVHKFKIFCYIFKIIKNLPNHMTHDLGILNAKILYTVEPKTATSPCVHFEFAASPKEKKTSLLHVSILSHFEIVEIIGPNTQEMT